MRVLLKMIITALIALPIVVFSAVTPPIDSTYSDNRFPAGHSGTYGAVPQKYCCSVYLDYLNTIYVSNKSTGYLVDGVQVSGQTLYTNYGTIMGSIARPYGNIYSVTDRTSGSNKGDNNQNGQWLNCPAGFMMTGYQLLQAGDNTGKDDTAEAVICTAIRQTCSWIRADIANNAPAMRHYFASRNENASSDHDGGVDVGNYDDLDDYKPTSSVYNYCQ